MRLEQEGRAGLAVVLEDGSRHAVGGATLDAYEEPGFDYEGTRARWSEAAVYDVEGALVARVIRVLEHDGGTGRSSDLEDWTSRDGGRSWSKDAALRALHGITPRATLSTHREDMPLLLGRYRVTRPFGAGWSGPIFEAFDEAVGRPPGQPFPLLLVKTLTAVANDTRALARFAAQAKKVQGLRDPNVVSVHAWGIGPDGVPVVAMDRASKRALSCSGLAEGTRFLPDRARMVGDLVLAALEAAHAIGLAHGDLRPANVFLDRDPVTDGPVVKVADFGLAFVFEDAARTTTGGGPVGPLPYLAPERLQGAPPDVRSDVYGAGLVLWEMLAGRRAFTKPPVIALLSEIMTSSPPPLAPLTRDAPPELVAVVERAIAKDPADRFPSAAAMRAALAVTDG